MILDPNTDEPILQKPTQSGTDYLKLLYELLTEEADAICESCSCPPEYRGIHLGPNGPYGCEGSHCKEAFESYVDENLVVCPHCGLFNWYDGNNKPCFNCETLIEVNS